MDNTSMRAYCETRLKNMLVRDKNDNPQKINNVLRAEILYVLRNYLELNDYDVEIDISITKEGMYHIKVEADCRNIKTISYIG